uniref:Ovule protein n=1 Tax=Panagrolaimus sp. ES5 TaxID=591445 RepID=A0AC34G2L2_9BILA
MGKSLKSGRNKNKYYNLLLATTKIVKQKQNEHATIKGQRNSKEERHSSSEKSVNKITLQNVAVVRHP